MTAETYICPTCGSEVAVGGTCPGCGPAKAPRRKPRRQKVARAARKPWEQDEASDGLDLPDGDFNYEEFVEREFGGLPHRRIGIKWYWWLTAALLVAGLAWLAFSGIF